MRTRTAPNWRVRHRAVPLSPACSVASIVLQSVVLNGMSDICIAVRSLFATDVSMWRRRSATEQLGEQLGHRVQLIDVIGRRIPGKAEQLEAARAYRAELLHAARPPTQDRLAAESE